MHATSCRRATRRYAPLLLVAAAVAFVAKAPAPTAAGNRHDAAAMLTAPRAHGEQRLPAPWPPTAALGAAGVALAVTSGAQWRRFVLLPAGLLRQRISDVGDDWRALLLGAPPAVG